MKHHPSLLGYTPTLTWEETDRNRQFWLSRPSLDEKTRENLRAANILIVPEGEDYEGKGAYFPEGTEDFYRFLRDQGVNVEVAAQDENFQELARHFDLKIMGEFVLEYVLAPLFVNMVWSYCQSRVLNAQKSAIKIGLTIQKADGSAKRLAYEGPLDEFEAKVKPLLQEFLDEPAPPLEPPALPPAPENETP